MNHQQILEYIKQNRSLGIKDDLIKQNLLHSGVSFADIEQVFGTMKVNNVLDSLPIMVFLNKVKYIGSLIFVIIIILLFLLKEYNSFFVSENYVDVSKQTSDLIAQDNYSEALVSANQMLQIAESNQEKTDSYRTLIYLNLSLGKLDEAETRLNEFEKIDPTNTEMHDIFVGFYLEETKSLWSDGKYEEMLVSANKALNFARDDQSKGFIHYWLGVGYFKLGQLDESEAEETLAIKFIPLESGPNITMAGVYSARGDFQKAFEYAQKAVELTPDYAWAHNSLGLVLSDLGNKEEAIKELEKAVQLDPETSLFRLNLTRIKEQ